MNIMKKFITSIVGLSMVLTMVPGLVQGQTIAELQAQIATLMAQLTALQAQVPGTTPVATAPTFTRNLTVGSRGDDVAALQAFLVQRGHLVMPAGVATGFFGPLTRTALAAYQAAVGITPAAGFLGPVTRAHFAGLTAITPPVTPPVTPPLTGTEGTFRNVTQLHEGAVLREGERDRRVIGVEFDASGSDLRVERFDVLFALNSETGVSSRPWRYFETVSLYRGTTLLASLPAGSVGNWLDEGNISNFGLTGTRAYRMSFTGLREVVRMGEKAELRVAVSMLPTIDTTDAGAVWAFRIPVNGIRAVDAAGINQFAPSTFIPDTANFATALPGELFVTSRSDLNRGRVAQVASTTDTLNVELINFSLRAATSPVRVTTLTATTTETFAGPNFLADGVRRFALLRNGAVIRTISAPTVTGTSLIFSDLNFVIPVGTTDEFVIRADMRDTEGTAFASSHAISIPGVVVTAEAPDTGRTVTQSGSAVGGLVTFFDRGINVTLIDRSATVSPGVLTTGPIRGDSGNFTIRFRVSAFGGDAFIMDGGVATPGGTGDGALFQLYATAANEAAIRGTLRAVLTAAAGEDGTSNHIVRDGMTRDFTLTVGATASTSAAFVRVGLEGVRWSPTNIATGANLFNFGMTGADASTWQTDNIELR